MGFTMFFALFILILLIALIFTMISGIRKNNRRMILLSVIGAILLIAGSYLMLSFFVTSM